jgi:tungstate transport system substrate-binding protein
MTQRVRSLAVAFLLLLEWTSAVAQEPFIIVASTTSTEESGLFGYLLPSFTKETGIQVRVVAVGTGQALKIGERGDCDVVFVRDRPAELAFVERASVSTAMRSCIMTSFWLVRRATQRVWMEARTS